MITVSSLAVDPGSGIPINQQIKSQLTWMMAVEQLKPGERLPSVRALSAHLRVNIQTVRTAYLRLEEEGLVATRQGFGTVVQTVDFSRFETRTRSVRSHLIGMILPSMSNPFYHTFVEGVEKTAAEDGSLLLLCCTHDDPNLAYQFFRQLLARDVDGVILASCLIPGLPPRDARSLVSLPVVFADSPGSRGVNILMDLENAGYLGTRHLLEHGHRRIGLITHKMDFQNIVPINNGYRRALQEASISFDMDLAAQVESFDIEAGAAGARQLLEMANPPTAIFCIADMLALGAIREIKCRGLSIPRNVAVVGFNNIPSAAFSDPPLTSVDAPAFEMGVESMKRLRGLITGTPPPEREVTLPTRLVVRESCGAHPVSN
jgi:LacI family transcriptional regulator, repressor for deo operon, udp, cdd, tsx, nupC, and nupG